MQEEKNCIQEQQLAYLRKKLHVYVILYFSSLDFDQVFDDSGAHFVVPYQRLQMVIYFGEDVLTAD